MSNADKSCKTCLHFAVPLDKAGRRIVRSKYGYLCKVKIPMPPLPDSVRSGAYIREAHTRMSMNGSDGSQCPYWEKWERSKECA
jgi:hypothetical protein